MRIKKKQTIKDWLDSLDPHDKPYALRQLFNHVANSDSYRAKYKCEIYEILKDYDFIKTKAVEVGVLPLLQDYDLILQENPVNPEDESVILKLIRDAIRQSLPALSENLNQLESQLLARLRHCIASESQYHQPKSIYSLPKSLTKSINIICKTLFLPLLILSLLPPMMGSLVFRHSFIGIIHLMSNIQVKIESFFLSLKILFFDIPQSNRLVDDPNLRLPRAKGFHEKEAETLNYSVDIKLFLRKLEEAQADSTWLRPLTPSLNSPNSQFLGVFQDPSDLNAYWRAIAVFSVEEHEYLIAGARDGKLRIWDLKTGTLNKVLSGHTSGIESIAVAVTSQDVHIISGTDDGSLISWDFETGARLQTFEGHSASVNAANIYFNPVNSRFHVVSGSQDGSLIIWDLQTGKRLKTLLEHSEGVNAITVTSDGQRVVSASDDNTLIIWDLQTGKFLRKLQGHEGYVQAVEISTNGRSVISGSGDGSIIIWDLHEGRILLRENIDAGPITAISIIPKGEGFITSSMDEHAIRVWRNVGDNRQSIHKSHIIRGGFGWSVGPIAVTPDRRYIVAACVSELSIWNLKRVDEKSLVTGHDRNAPVNSIAITPNGQYAVTAGGDENLRIWELASGYPVKDIVGSENLLWVSITSDGKKAVSLDEKQVNVWDLSSGFCVQSFENHNEDKVAALSSQGYLALWCSNRKMTVLDLQTGLEVEHLTKWTEHGDTGYVVLFTPDGESLIFSSYDRLVILDCRTGKEVDALYGHSGYIQALAISLDGELLASAAENMIIIWDLGRREILTTITSHQGTVRGLAISHDKRILVSVSSDKTIRTWSLQSHHEIARFTGDRKIVSCALSPDGTTVVAGEFHGQVHFLRLENFDKIAQTRF